MTLESVEFCPHLQPKAAESQCQRRHRPLCQRRQLQCHRRRALSQCQRRQALSQSRVRESLNLECFRSFLHDRTTQSDTYGCQVRVSHTACSARMLGTNVCFELPGHR